MNRKIGLVLVVIALIAGVIWLFQKPTPAPAAPTVAVAPKPAPTIEAPKPVAKSAVAAPVAATAAAKPAAAPAKPGNDPQAELNTAIADMISLIQAQDMLTAVQRYLPPDFLAKMPPEEKADMEREMTVGLSSPDAQQGMQMMVQVLQGMQTQTPTLNAAGDTATYQLSDPTGRATKTVPFNLRKIDGKWYVDPESMGGM